MSGSHRILLGTVLTFASLVAGVLAVVGSQGAHRQRSSSGPTTSPTTIGVLTALPAPGWRPVPPVTTVPEPTPVQQQYDEGFEQGFSSPANEAQSARIEALSLPAPSIGGGWPRMLAADTPEEWSQEFVQGLLDIDFAHQSRGGLGRWLVAQEAPDLMPGIPAGAADRTLYASVMEPGIEGQPSVVPSAAQWQADAAAGLRWSVSSLEVQLDPQWQSMIDAGWQPRDLRAAVEDVSGVMSVTEGPAITTRRFSTTLQLGSARWHDGYGTVLVSGWKDS
jgi:hypothetical protein